MPFISNIKSRGVSSSLKEMRVSFKIIILLFVLMIGVFVGGYIVVSQLKIFKNDAFIINHIGIIRGSIQRISKRELSNKRSDKLIADVDVTFKLVKSYYVKNSKLYFNHNEDVIKAIQALDALWGELKIYFSNHRMKNIYSKEIIEKSELCWEQANALAFSIQKDNEIKLNNYKNEIIQILALVGFLILAIIIIVYKIVHENLEMAVITDSMTNLYNRNYFDTVLMKQISISQRYNSTFSLIVLDLDYFKKVNDVFGHQKGDEVLILFSQLLTRNIRSVDFAFRIGGEEFAIILPQTNLKQASRLADKYRMLISETDFNLERKLTASLGVTEYFNDITSKTVYKRADKALYQAKSEGRNTVVSISYD